MKSFFLKSFTATAFSCITLLMGCFGSTQEQSVIDRYQQDLCSDFENACDAQLHENGLTYQEKFTLVRQSIQTYSDNFASYLQDQGVPNNAIITRLNNFKLILSSIAQNKLNQFRNEEFQRIVSRLYHHRPPVL